MIIEFKLNEGIGADVDWISKFMYEEEVLLPPWLIAAPHFSPGKSFESNTFFKS